MGKTATKDLDVFPIAVVIIYIIFKSTRQLSEYYPFSNKEPSIYSEGLSFIRSEVRLDQNRFVCR